MQKGKWRKPTIVVSELLQDDLLSGELGEEDVLAVDETGD